MRNTRLTQMAALGAVAAMTVAACGSDSEPAAGVVGGNGAGLASVCPETITIQTDWFPEAEHGAMYQMIDSANATIDADVKTVTGPLVAGGEATGVNLQVRTGGPKLRFRFFLYYCY